MCQLLDGLRSETLAAVKVAAEGGPAATFSGGGNVAKVDFMITVGAAESRYVPAAHHLRATDTIVDGPS